MKSYPQVSKIYFFCFLLSCFFSASLSLAQSKSDIVINNQWANTPVEIDGKLTDWGDSLRNYNENTRFSYSLKNNRDVLYLAIKSQDKQNLNRIIARGISFSFNTEGKKKQGETLIFPVFDRGSATKKTAKPSSTPQQIKLAQEQLLSRITRLFVIGFSEIKDGPVSLQNSYGVSAAAGFDEQNQLVVEIAIPFKQLQIANEHDLLACLIEINGIKQPRPAYDPNRNARNSRYGNPNRNYDFDRRPAVDKQSLATGFWIKSNLAHTPKDL